MSTITWVWLALAGVFALAFRKALRVILRPVWRFVLGHHMVDRRTDYGAWRPATKAAPHARSVTWWGRAPMVTRAGIRISSLASLALVLWCWSVAPGVTLAALVSILAALVGLAAWRAVRLVRTWRHRTRLVKPLAAALAPLVSLTPQETAPRIRIPHTFARVSDGELGHLILPDHFRASPEERKAIGHLVSSRLPVDVETSWRTSSSPQRLLISASPKPPAMVTFAEMRAEMDACQPGDIVLGLDRRRTVYRGSFRTEDPHWGASCGSGRGKSSWLQLVAAQALHQDPLATVTGVDPKMSSLDPLIGVPGVTVANDPRNVPGMWAAIDDFAAEMNHRMDQQAEDPTIQFPLALLIVDELNQFSSMSSATWRELKEKGDPATAPVWMTLASVGWQGRAFNCHMVLVGQRLDDRATGGIGLRDSLGLRALAGFTPQQWAMLVGTSPIPRSQRPRGRWIYSDGQESTWVQNVYMTPEEVRAYALEGRRQDVATAGETSPVPAQTAGTATDTGGSWIVGLDAGAEHLELSPAAFRKRRERAGGTIPGELRQGNQPAWTPADLDAWRASWPRVVSPEKSA